MIENGHNHSQPVSMPGHGQAKQGDQDPVGLQNVRLDQEGMANGTMTNGLNWAGIVAGGGRTRPNFSAETSDPQPEPSIPGLASYRNLSTVKQPSVNVISHLLQAPLEAVVEDGKAGVVYVQGKTAGNFVHFITTRIHEGPLYEIKIDGPTKATITFQHLLHAQLFIDRNQELVMSTGRSCFGSGYTLSLGEPIEWHANLRRMNHPARERRRLTFAKSKLFSDQLSPQKWEREVASVAGPGNLEFTWIFNTGNGKNAL
ncbi:hypothetical protein VTN77DRAFT_7882 [Rasamsonia byssochlamydoides]|uniref:uncharacterized protein n=1 Tax=Rasamsonia byssochlamydoides TaxID=89139 RepID=UPI0037442021